MAGVFRVFLSISLSIFLSLHSATSAQDSSSSLDDATIAFLEDVLVGTEYGAPLRPRCVRWVTAPRLSTFGPGSHHPAIVNIVVRELNECLPEECQIRLLEANDESATLKVHFLPRDQFESEAEANGFQFSNRNLGFFRIDWNGKYEIESARVWIAADRLTGNTLRHYVLEEITQSLGLPGDSPLRTDSVFYEDASRREFGTATRLSKMDRQAIRFLYRHVPPGASPVQLGVLLERHWDSSAED